MQVSREGLPLVNAGLIGVIDQAKFLRTTPRTDVENFATYFLNPVLVRDVVPGSEVRFADGASPDTRNYRVDCTRLPQTVPAYQPKWTVERGARELYEAYKRSDVTLAEFEGERYRRITHIQELIRSGELDTSLRHTGGAR